MPQGVKSTLAEELGKRSIAWPPEAMPEDAGSRPCRCPSCCDLPLPCPTQDAEDQKQAKHPDSNRSTFVGVYPRGFASIALGEVERAGCVVAAHHEAYCALLFHLPLSSNTEKAVPETTIADVELGTFDTLFEVLGTAIWLPLPVPSRADVAIGIHDSVQSNLARWRSELRCCGSWRVTMHREGKINSFKSPEVAPIVGDVLASAGAISIIDGCTAGPEVNLKKPDVEVMVYLSDGVDETVVTNGETRSKLASETPKLLLLGLRTPSERALVRPPCLGIVRDTFASHPEETVAFNVAHHAVDSFFSSLGSSGCIARDSITVLDPMCGAGTFLIAVRWVLSRRATAPFPEANFLGFDIEADCIDLSRRNALAASAKDEVTPSGTVVDGTSWATSFEVCSSASLSLKDCSVDLLVVDPPWGLRCSSYATVNREFALWAAEWARVLKPGGVAVVVTVCTSLVDNRVLPPLVSANLLVVESMTNFENKGFTQCRMYTLRKPCDTSH